MNSKILPTIAVALGAWMLVGDIGALKELQVGANAFGTIGQILADILLLYLGGQALKQQRKAIAQ